MKVSFSLAFLVLLVSPAVALDYPGKSPGKSDSSRTESRMVLSNQVLEIAWDFPEAHVAGVTLLHRQSGQRLLLDSSPLPQVVFDDGRTLELSKLKPVKSSSIGRLEADAAAPRKEAAQGGYRFAAVFRDTQSGLRAEWSVELRDGSNYVVQGLVLRAEKDVGIQELVFVDGEVNNASRLGEVDGSVLVYGDIFLAVEHPLAANCADRGRMRCALPRGNVLKAGQEWNYSSVFGVVPSGQLRRGFLYYLERRRAHPYRPFLHYNSWYHLNIGRPDNHMTEPECLETIHHLGRELILKRGARLDAFVWDDGWDDFNSLWGFHRDFPDGFRKLKDAGAKYGAAQGVWMSPWGGYGKPKEKRIAYGSSQGYETNARGYSMAGKKYGQAFRDVSLRMMREHGVGFFKFDGMGTGNNKRGAKAEAADDVDAVLKLTRTLRRENPDLFISATVGTWASPFWTFYADSIWRQGGDTGFHGPGDTRRQWITYRDKFCYEWIVQKGPLYPLNSLMLHGPCIGERANPAKMVRDEKPVADEIWTFFGSGTNLQELYISPQLLTGAMWDELAAAARWSRANSGVLVDTHWIGGNPGEGEVYGWGAWQPGKGILTLRNPSDKPRVYALELVRDLDLPEGTSADFVLSSPRAKQRIDQLRVAAVKPFDIEILPFEVLVFEATPAADGGN